jgi:hypothetical protein
VNTTAQFMQTTEESIPLSAAVAVSLIIAEEKVAKMIQMASVDIDFRKQFASAIKRSDKDELIRLSARVKD